MKRIIIVICIFITQITFSQKNTLSIGLNNYKFYKVLNFDNDLRNIKYITLDYKRNFILNYNYKINFSVLNPLSGLEQMTLEHNIVDTNSIGKIESRKKYSFIDVSVGYKTKLFKRNYFSTNIGTSFAYGKDTYKESLAVWWPSPDHVVIKNRTIKDVQKLHIGLNFDFHYDYMIYHNKINLGLNSTLRYFGNKFPLSIFYGIHVGYNF